MLATPFVRRRSALFVAVPTFAVAGVVVLGVIALVIACVFARGRGARQRRLGPAAEQLQRVDDRRPVQSANVGVGI